MNELWQHLPQVSAFGAASALFPLMLVASLVFTLIHAVQEYKGRLWRYFGAIGGLTIPDGIGIAVFVVLLLIWLWVMALAGIAGWLPGLGSVRVELTMIAIGFLIGGRLADSWFSHLRLARRGYRPNPGLSSTPLYVMEAAMLTIVFGRGLAGYPAASTIGLALGILLFFSVLPVVRLLRAVLWSIRREPWIAGQPRPSWIV